MQDLIIENMKLVGWVVNKYFSKAYSHEYEDLQSAGYIGLVTAAKKYDPEFKAAFSTYAIPMIIGSIKRYIRDTDINTLHVSRPIKELYYKYFKLKEIESFENICEELKVSPETLQKSINAMMQLSSLEFIVDEENNRTLGEIIPDERNTEDQALKSVELKEKLAILKKRLSEKQYKTLILRLQGKTQTEISKIVGVSQVHICRYYRQIDQNIREINKRFEVAS